MDVLWETPRRVWPADRVSVSDSDNNDKERIDPESGKAGEGGEGATVWVGAVGANRGQPHLG